MQPQVTFFHRCVHAVYLGAISLAIACVIFTVMERLFSFGRIKKPWRSTVLDLQYAFLGFLYPPVIHLVLSAVFAYIAIHGQGKTHNPGVSVAGFVGELLALLFVRDILIYIRHRIFHTRMVWAFHSIHHSSEEVNWLSAVRFHPIEDIIEGTGEALLFAFSYWVICVPAGVLSVAGITIALYNLMEHSNLRWSFGPLRYVFVSPVFHRWHHSDSKEAMNKNFAAMFSCIDLICGTFYMPAAIKPGRTGLGRTEQQTYPGTFIGQFIHPFKRN